MELIKVGYPGPGRDATASSEKVFSHESLRVPGKVSGTRTSDHLNLIRGLAAMAVLVYHVRYRFFLDYKDLDFAGWSAKAFYALTSFGHDAVIVFFVLSGYFIASSVMRDCATGRWSWTRYAVSRWVRLALVLVPGLLLTVCLDKLGLELFGSNPIYTGASQAWYHDFFPVTDRLNASTFLANLVFLQTVVAPPLGSNEPLWSLSFEFWYYILFPCAWLALLPSTRLGYRLVLVATFLILLVLLGSTIALYFPIWLLGALVAFLPLAPPLRCRPHATAAASGLLFLGTLVLTHTASFRQWLGGSVMAADYINGLAFAVLLFTLLHDRAPAGQAVYSRMATGLAAFSFTLYVTHMPLLVFLRAGFIPGKPWQPDWSHMACGGLLTAAAIAFALVLARLTESRTDGVREFLLARIGLLSGKVPAASRRTFSGEEMPGKPQCSPHFPVGAPDP